MTLLWMDGYEWADQSLTGLGAGLDDVLEVKSRRFFNASTDITNDATIVTGRGGRGNAMVWKQNAQEQSTPQLLDSAVQKDLIFGFAFKSGATFINNGNFCKIYSGDILQADVRYNTGDDTFRFFRGNGTQIAASPTNLVNTQSWYYIEFKIRIDNSTGFIVMRLDGKVVWESATTLDSRNITEGTFWDRIQSRWAALSNGITVDDIYVCDTSGTENNDFLGDVTVEAIFPQSDGDFTEWAKSSGSNHVDLIDDVPLTALADDTDYVETNVLNETELFQFTDLSTIPENVEIYGVQTSPIMRITDAVPKGLVHVTRGKNREAAKSPTLSSVLDSNKVRSDSVYFVEATIFTQEPRDNRQWTVRDINETQFGVRLVT